MTDATDHWTGVWSGKAPADTSWFQEVPEPCSGLVRRFSTPADHVAVVGVGASPLIADLLSRGYSDVEAVDVSPRALERLRDELGADAVRVRLRQADVRTVRFDRPLAMWHDRATFHFLTEPVDRAAYAAAAAQAVREGGHAIMATFGLEGPDQCSGLPVARYDAASLAAQFAPAFELGDTLDHTHVTPWGTEQPFVYAVLRRR